MKIPERGICIATRYRTVAELVERMHPYCDEQSLFVATSQLRATGTRAKFALQLADRTVALIGWCEVMQAWSTADNRYRRPGVQFALQRLTPASQVVFDQLIAARLTSHRNRPSVTSRLASRAHLGPPDDTGERTLVKIRTRPDSARANRAWRRRPTGPTRPSRPVRPARDEAPPGSSPTSRPAQPDDAARTDRFQRVASVTRQDRAARPTNPIRRNPAARPADGARRAAPTERLVPLHSEPLDPTPPDAPLGVTLPLPAPPDVPSLDATLSLLLADSAHELAAPAPPPRAPSGTNDLSAAAAAAVLDAEALAGSPRVRWGVVAITALTVLALVAGIGLGLLR